MPPIDRTFKYGRRNGGGTSGSGFLDMLGRSRRVNPTADPTAEIRPDRSATRDENIYDPMQGPAWRKMEGLPGSFKKGGKVKKTGTAKVHKGERVLTAKQAKKPAVKKALRKPVARRRR